ncbi:uncharacterized protein LOC132886624 isoform X1 [Neoarius graeffei]|uniref:uncharacterized protein LOC132886624 isoform X1 n=1 Tax=Neoarius graeffei TaxID=443677 RepID=UPI00298C364F|nr:uncharacterized protein LOC132886624 isoform X1 [Neoarius graeffei]XP_060777492.1 uncharacterized protein LOC132886624 isoform X1 [Neoarius graeffei]XP_060777493.1 uncharacterized protein LOC132886624 isoform X1 [Neoarius graeffei]XP_060777494.1 uncharacterized protein LOC132886624 isoform X1 [Neoarius graeffei]XP_060777495.1 uncharacterized protein LOC132886624 isoform X1 [Neoarius graeffei]
MQTVEVKDFIASPSEEILDQCTKDQLLKLAEHYQVEVNGQFAKDKVKAIVKSNLVATGVLIEREPVSITSPLAISMEGLSFDQRKELLLLQIQHEKYKIEAEFQKDLAVEKLRQETEQTRLDLEHKLQVIREGKITPAPRLNSGLHFSVDQSDTLGFDVRGNLRLVPKFSESDPDTFFLLFERLADAQSWPNSARALLLQCVITGKAQEAFSALSPGDSQDYDKVKLAVLKAYECVPEHYRQKFRSWKRGPRQSHLEFARDLTTYFNRWCSSVEVSDFDGLCDLIVLEQFKNSVPHVATYVCEHKARTAAEAVALADDCVNPSKHSI